jgi:hypothetical protein
MPVTLKVKEMLHGFSRNPFFVAVLWTAWETSGLSWAADPLRDDIVHDFRGRPLPQDMALFGQEASRFVKTEADGLRLTLPRDRKEFAPVGLSMPLSVQGDFEITVAFEILQADEPAQSSYGVGVLMSVNEAARVGRLIRANGKQVVTWDRWATVAGKRQFLTGALPSPAKAGKLRLKRTGTILQFLWSPESAGDSFEEIHQCDFGLDDITLLRLELSADTGGRHGALDVRFRDLHIRTEAGETPWWLVPAAAGREIGRAHV